MIDADNDSEPIPISCASVVTLIKFPYAGSVLFNRGYFNSKEFLKCKADPVYFTEKHIRIVNVDEGLVHFNMYKFQKKLIKNFHKHRFNICKMPRQTGKSTTVVSYLLHYAIFNDNVNIGILANKAATARDLLGRLQLAYENLPRWMQQGIIAWNKGSMELENGSKIIAAST